MEIGLFNISEKFIEDKWGLNGNCNKKLKTQIKSKWKVKGKSEKAENASTLLSMNEEE